MQLLPPLRLHRKISAGTLFSGRVHIDTSTSMSLDLGLQVNAL